LLLDKSSAVTRPPLTVTPARLAAVVAAGRFHLLVQLGPSVACQNRYKAIASVFGISVGAHGGGAQTLRFHTPPVCDTVFPLGLINKLNLHLPAGGYPPYRYHWSHQYI
jgi:hypothetical protein